MATAVHSTTARPARRQPWHRYRPEIEAMIERLIDILDVIDGDPDLEPSLAFPECQPRDLMPGGFNRGFLLDCNSSQLGWDHGRSDDREDDAGDNPEEPGAMPYLGWAEPDVVRVRRARA